MKILHCTPGFVFLFVFSTACKKGNNKSTFQNYMRFSLNGISVNCDNKFYASPKLTVGQDANITFYARWGDNELDFQLFTFNTDITTGQYVFGPNKAYAAEIWPQGTALLPGTHPSYLAGSTVQSASIEGSGQITISEINAEHIRGSFDFVTGVNGLTGLSMTVTNGQFDIKR
jgi:Family of unknown function (DUF6252)